MGTPLDTRTVISTWWPLAASWLMMGLELPAVSAVLARLNDPAIHLAAYGGIVFPLALLVEAPIIMLLAASTALARDRVAYRKLRRFVFAAAGVLTLVHLAITVTPLYGWVVGTLLHAPPEIRAPARLGLLLMTPWSASIAYRRFRQGVLIRFGHSRAVGIGTVVRLTTNVSMLAVGALLTDWSGIVVGTAAIATGVVCEAIFVGFRSRSVVRHELPDHDPGTRPLTRASFVRFYTPLALTSLLTLVALPLGSAAMGRMPFALESLAVWPVINGLSFTLRSLGLAYNEVVVALLDREDAFRVLLAFAVRLAALASGVLLLIAATPLAVLWFAGVSALPVGLAHLAHRALWIAVPLPAASVMQALLGGLLVHQHRTRGISEAVGVQLAVIVTLLAVGAAWSPWPGIFVGVCATLIAILLQLSWLLRRALPSIRELRGTDLVRATAIALLVATTVRATEVPIGYLHEPVIGGPFGKPPVAFAFLPDERIVLVERETGVVRLAAMGASTSDAIFTVPGVNADHPERGLLGVAVDPEWPARPYLYFHHTATDATVKIVMFRAAGALTDPSSTTVTLQDRFVLLDDIDDTAGIHNAGTLRFTPAGKLLVSVGDDGQSCRAQDLASPLGKLLRLEVSTMPRAGPGPPALADLDPGDNPFPGGAGYQRLVRAWGLRNPFRFSVDARTGDVFIGSVGQNHFEEINRVPGRADPGLNFGWPQLEGSQPVLCCGDCGAGNVFTAPIYTIPHPVGIASVIGGVVLRHVPGSTTGFPASLDGDYLFLEIFSGDVFRLRRRGDDWRLAPPLAGQPDPSRWGTGFVGAADVQQGPDGAVYLCSIGLNPGRLPAGLHRLRADDATPGGPWTPPPSFALRMQPNPAVGGQAVTIRFRSPATGSSVVRVTDAAGRLRRHFRVDESGDGERTILFDGHDQSGAVLGAGVYFVSVVRPVGHELAGKLTWIP